MKKTNRIIYVIAAVLLLEQFALQLYLARIDSQTTDEGVHLSAGYTYLTKYDFRFNPEHPPLIKMLAATPLLFLKINTPPDFQYFDRAADFYYDSWKESRAYGGDLLYRLGNNADLMLFLSRVPMALVTLLLGLTIFVVSTRLWSVRGGLLSLTLYSFEPLIAAHGHLVTTDVGVSLGYILAVYTFWLFLNKKSWPSTVLFGLSLGLAQLTKFTAVILVPAIILLFIYFVLTDKSNYKKVVGVIGKIIVALTVCYVVICAGYGFKLQSVRVQTRSSGVAILDRIASTKSLGKIRNLLVPKDYFKGLAMVVGHTQGGHSSFLLGQKSRTGWWYYFPVVFWAKSTIPLLILSGLAIILTFAQKKDRRKRTFFLLGALIFFGFTMTSKADLGVRHIMPVYALLFVLVGSTVESFWLKTQYLQIALATLLVWLAVEFVAAFPYYLGYYNELCGGTINGYKVANDSNYDWGQDLKRVKQYLSTNQIKNPWVEYGWDGEASLDYYEIPRRPLDTLDLNKEGFLVIGSTALNDEPYESLQTAPIYARITPSVFLYKLK